jgi:hypothetical protein
MDYLADTIHAVGAYIPVKIGRSVSVRSAGAYMHTWFQCYLLHESIKSTC